MSDLRIGQGFDIHRLATGRKLVIGGFVVEHDRGSLGHSDGDVLCHAIIDAMLGALCLGDIGKHFPPSDKRYEGACSLDLLKAVDALIKEAGYEIVNLDTTVILEKPKLGRHIDTIAAILAENLGLDRRQISIKAKTHEGMGEIGQGDAVAAQSVVLLHRRAL